MPSHHSVVALLTDFGTSDHYVAAVKGAILSVSPSITVVDITHDIPPQNIASAAYALWAAYPSMPQGTVFCVVVDPGVGTERRILAASSGRHIFVAPANGVLDMVLWSEQIGSVTEIDLKSPEVRSLLPGQISKTFHGRDVFAPLCAHIAGGANLRKFGRQVEVDWVKAPLFAGDKSQAKPRILHIDRFGNIITNIRSEAYTQPGFLRGVLLGGVRIDRWVENFESAPANVPCLIAGSSGLVEIVMRKENAARKLQINESIALDIIRT